MGRLTCSQCKEKKPLISLPWFRCSRHGVVCRKCSAGGIISSHKCPKCANKLKEII